MVICIKQYINLYYALICKFIDCHLNTSKMELNNTHLLFYFAALSPEIETESHGKGQ